MATDIHNSVRFRKHDLWINFANYDEAFNLYVLHIRLTKDIRIKGRFNKSNFDIFVRGRFWSAGGTGVLIIVH